MTGFSYREAVEADNPARLAYLSGLEAYAARRQAEAARSRDAADLLAHPEEARKALCAVLGEPLASYAPGPAPRGEMTPLFTEGGIRAFRVTLEVLPEVPYGGILLLREGEEPRPLVICAHGKLGTPELACGFHGSTTNYHDFVTRILDTGVHAFVPRMMLWSDGHYHCRGVDCRDELDARLKQTGSSVCAVELYCLRRAMDWLCELPAVKADAIGMAGLSYGAFYTQYLTAMDTRIRSAVACSYFNDRTRYGLPDMNWQGIGNRFLDAELALLCYPRRLQLAVGDKDEMFDAKYAREEWARYRRMAADLPDDRCSFRVFEGGHGFFPEDEPLRLLASDLTEASDTSGNE